MKKLIILFFMVMATLVIAHSANKGNKDILGEWKFDSPSAAYGYQKGSIIVSEKEKKLTGEIKFEDGYKVKLTDVSFSDGAFKFFIYIESNHIGVTATIDGKKMNGTADSPDGKLPFTAEKVK